jgi:hypothetical protein
VNLLQNGREGTGKHDELTASEGQLLALFGHALISELSLLSGAKRKLDLETPKGRYWRIVLKNSPVEAEGVR